MNLSLASKQDLTLMQKHSKLQQEQSQVTISADENLIPQSLQASEYMANGRKISYNFKNINQEEQVTKERRSGGNLMAPNKPVAGERAESSMIQNLIKNKI